MNIKTNYKHTMYASYIGYITQAIINNFAPLLFLTFQGSYRIPFEKITLLVTLNFGVQLFIDFLAARYADRIGYKPLIVTAHICAALGLTGLGILPGIFSEPYIGLVLAVILYAIGGGLIEVLVSPIVEACPTDKKPASMSLLHSFYCWGQVFVVACSALYFFFIGIEKWKALAVVWAAVPLLNAVYFSLTPIRTLSENGESMPVRQLLSLKLFWLFVLLMVCSGASELAMSQWASAFAESGLKVSKFTGDLAGPCLFAVLMGASRVFYSKYSDKLNLRLYMTISGIMCVAGYLTAALSPYPALAFAGCGLCGLSVGILWPGTFSLAAIQCPRGGTAMFAMLALAGDLGCSLGPTIVGMVSGAAENGIKTGLLAAIVFPILLIIGLYAYKKQTEDA